MKHKVLYSLLLTFFLVSCHSTYRIASVQGSMIKMDSSWDKSSTPLAAMVETYKQELDGKMNQIIGTSAEFMNAGQPESLLTNLTSDVMKAYGEAYQEGGVDFAVMNIHGHRSTMPKGEISVRNIFEIYSFDNTIMFLELDGSDVSKMFDAYARMGGAGISSNVRLVIENKKVASVTIDGKPIDLHKTYRIATLDYLANGNNGMSMFLNAKKSTDTGVTLRDVMMDYVKEQTEKGNEIRSKLDGRITLKK